jgi:hypothetical protein
MVLDLMERRSALSVNSDRDLLTKHQQTILDRLINDEIAQLLNTRTLWVDESE